MPIADITVNWGTKVIYVPKTATDLVQSSPTEIRQMDLNAFRSQLNNLQDDEEGMPYRATHSHNTTVLVGGVELSRVIEMINGYTVTFEDDQYAVNLYGANSNVADVTNVNQVSVRSANSAGLVSTQAIEFGEFGAEVTVDQTNGTQGTIYPSGTLRQACNNLTDAKLIASYRGFSRIKIIGDFTFLSTDILDGFEVVGQSATLSTVTLTEAATITDCIFMDATVTGTLDGGCDLNNCHINGLSYVDGDVYDCELVDAPITIDGDQAEFIRCWSGVAGSETPLIDMGGTGTDLLIRDWHGGITLSNYLSGDNNISIDIASGHIILTDTIQSGTFLIRGQGRLTDNSNGAVIDSEDLINKALLTDITNLVTDLREENPTTQEITKKVWDADLIDVDDEESAGYQLLQTSEAVEQNLVTPEQLATAVWSKDMSESFGPNTTGGLLKKIKLIYKILIS